MNAKTSAIFFGVLAAVLTIALAIVSWKYVELRKAIGVNATKTANPTSGAITSAVQSTLTNAQTITATPAAA